MNEFDHDHDNDQKEAAFQAASEVETQEDSLENLEAKQAELNRRIAQKKKELRGKVLAEVRQAVARFDLTEAEVFVAGKSGGKPDAPRTVIAPKYRHPETGETWTGRGRSPRWLDGLNKEDFAI